MPKKVIVIGAAIMDIIGFPGVSLIAYDSVPGRIQSGNGGVGRNIAENLIRLGVPTYFISAFGGDSFAEELSFSISELGGDTDQSIFLKDRKSALHLAMMDEENDMALGIAAMGIIQEITPAFLSSKKDFLLTGAKIVVETNIPIESLKWIGNNLKREVLAIDLVSFEMAKKVKNFIGLFGTVKANQKEAAVFLGRDILSVEDVRDAAEYLLSEGCKNIFITMGAEGVFYMNNKESGILKSPTTSVASTTGAGDAFISGVILGQVEAQSIQKSAQYGVAAAMIALESKETVSPSMSKAYLKEVIERVFN